VTAILLAVATSAARAAEDLFSKHPALQNPSEEGTTELILDLLPRASAPDPNRTRYLNLMKLSLTDLLYENDQVGRRKRVEGWDWPSRAYTMIGLRRLNNIQYCFEQAIAQEVPGDLIETGAWRGGATIFMRALLEAYGVRDRAVWVADSFEGLPRPDVERYPADAGMDLYKFDELAVSLEEVQRNFRRYGLLDDRVRFLKGWFRDTLPGAPIEKLAMLRMDADLYESTMDALVNLYPRLSRGGCLIVDDYFIPACRKAVHDYREQHGITDEIVKIDDIGAYWVKQ
jgi:hypothetical protein